jgi:hypothetical protein
LKRDAIQTSHLPAAGGRLEFYQVRAPRAFTRSTKPFARRALACRRMQQLLALHGLDR